MSRKAASPLAPVIARLRANGARVSTVLGHNPTSRVKPWLAYAVTMPNGGHRHVIQNHGHAYADVLARLERLAATLEAGDVQDTTSSSPGRTYLVGFPVVVTVHDDGSIDLEVCAEDIVEAVADDDNDEDADPAQQVADSATAGLAYETNNIRSITVNNRK